MLVRFYMKIGGMQQLEITKRLHFPAFFLGKIAYDGSRKERMYMKNRKLWQMMTVILAGTFLTSVSGCEKLVKSAVVEEKENQEKKSGRAAAEEQEKAEEQENAKEQENAESKESKMPDVQMQVQAPQKYEADFTDSPEGSKMKLHVKAEATVEVPDVEAIRLKEVEPAVKNLEQMKSWVKTLSKGEECAEDFSGMEDPEAGYTVTDGKVTVEGVPCQYSYLDFQGAAEPDRTSYFLWDIDWASLTQQEIAGLFEDSDENEESDKEDKRFLEEAASYGENLLKELGLKDFRISGKELIPMVYRLGEGESEKKEAFLQCERMVEGVPVTYVRESLYPIYHAQADMEQSDEMDSEQWEWWDNEDLCIRYLDENMVNISYDSPVKISSYSDEAQFLLPFEEISQIFENTMAAQLTGPSREVLLDYNGVYFMYPDTDAEEVEMEITKVKLGYLRIREDEDPLKGMLIPVWDFFGTWKASGGKEETEMEESAVSLLTIDARDGTVIQRYRGY